MDLKRHKKKGYDGFKYLVKFIESLQPSKQKDIIEVAVLDDPVYMQWILKNIIGADYFFQLDGAEIENYLKRFSNGVEVIYKCFGETEFENKLLEVFLPKQYIKDYEEIKKNMGEVQVSARNGAKSLIVEQIRGMMDKGLVAEYMWKLPSQDIAFESKNQVRSGPVKYNYENGQVCLEGELNRTLREGSWNHYYDNGQIMAKGTYKRGSKEGGWTFYYSSGELKSRGDYEDNLKEGIWSEWDRSGNVKEIEYELGKKISLP